MGYELDCDSCDFAQTVERERDTYPRARDHEAEHPSHFVFISGKR